MTVQVPHGKRPIKPLPRHKWSRTSVPRPPGATVELRHAAGTEPELLRQRAMLDAVAALDFPFPKGRFAGRGIVICGGGEKYLPSVYVLVRLLRHLGCGLPVEVWHLGKEEMPEEMRGLLAGLGAVCVDGLAVRRVHPARRLGGWELKCYALMHSAFAEVLLLDADNCPVRDPEFLFTTPPYRKHGAIFWPDYTRFAEGQAVWVASGIPYRDEPEFESGQILVNKARCWRALHVAMHLNEHSDWWYRVVHGDKDTFHLAWRKIGQTYAMPEWDVEPLEATMLQHDFEGKVLFQHRNFAKWTLTGNRRIPGFRHEAECLSFATELRARFAPPLPAFVRKWDPARVEGATLSAPRSGMEMEGAALSAPRSGTRRSVSLQAVAARLCRAPLDYVRVGLGSRHLEFLPDGTIGTGADGCERWWDLRLVKPEGGDVCQVQLEVFGQEGLTFRARPARGGGWHGAWVEYERTEVTLRPIRQESKRAKKVILPDRDGRNGKKGQKGPVFHVPNCPPTRRKAVGELPKRPLTRREPVGDVPKRPPTGRKAMGELPKRLPTHREAAGDVPKRLPTVREAVGELPKRPPNDRKPVRDTVGRRRNARQSSICDISHL